jgi:acetyl-CoA carboxylase carboxyl transferase subunit alpha
LVDEVIPEPLGGAHRDPAAAIASVGEAVGTALNGLLTMDAATLKARRREKFLEMGKETIG